LSRRREPLRLLSWHMTQLSMLSTFNCTYA
jgi:hypothetical protein